MRHKPKAVVLDVIETCFAIDSLDEKLSELGLPAGSLKIWFPRVLRDAFALQVTGTYKGFAEIATGALASLLAENKIEPNAEKMEGVIKSFATLPVHPDVKESINSCAMPGFASPLSPMAALPPRGRCLPAPASRMRSRNLSSSKK